MNEKHSHNAFGVTLLATLAGFIAGLLLAPKSGAQTRKELREKAGKLEYQAKQGIEVAKETAEEGKKEFKSIADEIKIDAKELASDTKVRARRAATHAKTGAQNVESKARQAWGDREHSIMPKK